MDIVLIILLLVLLLGGGGGFYFVGVPGLLSVLWIVLIVWLIVTLVRKI